MLDAPQFRTMPAQTGWERLRFVSSELRMILKLLATGESLQPGVATPELIDLLGRYVEEGSYLRRSGKLEGGNAASEMVMRDYRTSLEHLHQILPKLEQQLRDDRARLAQERNRLSLASDWTTTTRLIR